MRKKIEKRIGPVPIALVAVLALAALISAGLWLTPNDAQAQDLQPLTENPSATKCEIVVAMHAGDLGKLGAVGSSVRDGGCNFNGEEAVVTFVNQDTNTKAYVAAYVTGGDEFSQIQATKIDGSSLGDEGINEHLLEIDYSTSGAGGIASHGKAPITINRSMAKSGQVYVFAYVTDAIFKQFADGTDAENVGIPLSVLVSDSTATRTFDARARAGAILALSDAAKTLSSAAKDAKSSGVFRPKDTAVTPQIEAGLPPTDVNVSGAVSRLGTLLKLTDGAVTANDAAILDVLLSQDSGYTKNVLATDPAASPGDGGVVGVLEKYLEDLEDVSRANATANEAENKAFDDAVAVAKAALAAGKATAAAAGDGAPQNFTNYTADIAVLVKFQDPAVEKVDEEIVSMVAPGRVNTNGVSVVSVMIRDKNKVGLSGFATLTIDPDAGADVVFMESNLKTHRVELSGGGLKTGQMATIEGLPKRGSVRVKVTASFNNGELVLEGYAYREGNPDMVTVMTYACTESSDEAEDDEQDACDEEMAASTDGTKFKVATSKLNEAMVFGPGEEFLVVSTVTDAAGNKLAEAVSTKEKRAEGVTSDTLTFGSPTMLKKESRTVGTVGDEGDAGSYDIEVASGSAKMTASVIVSDVASMIMVSCDPEMIATDSGLTDCTVTVTDAMGNIPSNLGEATNNKNEPIDDTVRVAVRSTDVNIIGVDNNNDAKLDADGMATFSVLLREDAPEGSITINVSSTIGDETLRANTTVVYGDPQSEPGMPMELGAPSITSVMSDADGMATVMLMPGDNATKHWAWAAPTDGSEGMWHGDSALAGDATMVTFSGLTSGMNYWFIAIAGRGTGTDSEWSAWSGWTAETPIQ